MSHPIKTLFLFLNKGCNVVFIVTSRCTYDQVLYNKTLNYEQNFDIKIKHNIIYHIFISCIIWGCIIVVREAVRGSKSNIPIPMNLFYQYL